MYRESRRRASGRENGRPSGLSWRVIAVIYRLVIVRDSQSDCRLGEVKRLTSCRRTGGRERGGESSDIYSAVVWLTPLL